MDYQNEYWEKNPNLHIEDATLKFKQIEKFLKKIQFKKKKILDLACGAGAITKKIHDYFSPHGIKVLGIDISEKAISHARASFEGPQFEVGDATNLKLAESTLDLVTVLDLFEHIDDYKSALNELNGLSEYYVFRLPMEDCLFSTILNLCNNYEYKRLEKKYGHIHHFNPKVWKNALKECGFKVIKEKYYKVPKRKFFLRNGIQKLIYPISPYLNNRINGGFMITLCRIKNEANNNS